MKLNSSLCLLQILASLTTLLAAACQPGGDELTVSDAWARPGLAGGSSAVYFQISNFTGRDEVLLAASSETARQVELHITSLEGGHASMHHQPAVPIPAGKVVSFEPGGLHVMLIELTRDLLPRDTLNLFLEFRNAGRVNLVVSILEP
jgi:periplasmic copper chaperone A